MKYILCILFLALFLSVCQGQSSNIHPLSIGDTVPDITLSPLVNYKTPAAKLSDFRGKLVILDFWSTWCSSCIAAMPKMEQLQSAFGDSIQIILVNPWESETDIKSRITKMKRYQPGTGLSVLPTVYGDSIWRKVFPHTSVPHHVWIDDKGKVIAITNGHNATKEHISMALKGESLHLTVKKDLKALGYNPWKEGLLKAGDSSLHPLSQSGFLPYSSGFGEGCSIITDSMNENYTRIWMNATVQMMYEFAFSPFHGTIRTILNVKSKSPFTKPIDENQLDDWKTKNQYSYQITLPLKDKNNLQEFMVEDLNRYFGMRIGIVGKKEMHEIPALVLTSIQPDSLRTTGKGREFLNVGDSIFQYTNTPFLFVCSCLHDALENMSKPLAFLDETGFSGNVDMTLSGDLHDLQNVKEQLKKYGLEIKEEKRKMEVLVIKDR